MCQIMTTIVTTTIAGACIGCVGLTYAVHSDNSDPRITNIFQSTMGSIVTCGYCSSILFVEHLKKRWYVLPVSLSAMSLLTTGYSVAAALFQRMPFNTSCLTAAICASFFPAGINSYVIMWKSKKQDQNSSEDVEKEGLLKGD